MTKRLYADPAHFQDFVDNWSREFAEKMQVKASAGRPLEWWANRPTFMVRALERFHEAVLTRELSFTRRRTVSAGSPSWCAPCGAVP